MFYSLSPALDVYDFYNPQNIIKVLIKTKSSSIFQAPPFITVSQKDSGYLYQTWPANIPAHITLWWIQKQSLSVPDADSVFITVKI